MSVKKSNKKRIDNQRRGVIYLIHCKPENKYYVGQTRQLLERRWKQHLRAKISKRNPTIQLIDQKIKEYGEDAFELTILEEPLVEDLNEREKYWIEQKDTLEPNGYNRNRGGGATGRIILTDEEEQSIIDDYISGLGCQVLSKKYGYGESFIINLIKYYDVLRSEEERLETIRKNIYYRLDPDTLEVLEEYTSFSLIGKWAQENDLTNNKNASTAGMSTYYAMLFDTIVYGFRWNSSWTEEEKEEKRKARNKDRKYKNKNQNIPNRKELKTDLHTLQRKDILEKYNISAGCLDNWKKHYCLDHHGNDTEGWKDAPEQYVKGSVFTPSYEELLLSLNYKTFSEAAKIFGVSTSTYRDWLAHAGLPYKREEVDRFLNKPKNKTKTTVKTQCDYQILSYEVLKESLFIYNTIKEAYIALGLNESNYKKQLKIANLPYNAASINEFRKQHGYEIRRPSYSDKRPTRDDLKNLIHTHNFSEIGRKFGVSDNCVKKWCRYYGLPDLMRIIRQINDEDWDYACEHWEEVKCCYFKND